MGEPSLALGEQSRGSHREGLHPAYLRAPGALSCAFVFSSPPGWRRGAVLHASVRLWVVGAKNMLTMIDSKSHLVINDGRQRKSYVCLAAVDRFIDNKMYNGTKTSEGQTSRKYSRYSLTLLEH